MSVYECDICDGCYCCDENPCYESPLTKFGLICEDCAVERGCFGNGEYDKDLLYCNITDQFYHGACLI